MIDRRRRLSKLEAEAAAQRYQGSASAAAWEPTPEQAMEIFDILLAAGGIECVQAVFASQGIEYEVDAGADQ